MSAYVCTVKTTSEFHKSPHLNQSKFLIQIPLLSMAPADQIMWLNPPHRQKTSFYFNQSFGLIYHQLLFNTVFPEVKHGAKCCFLHFSEQLSDWAS